MKINIEITFTNLAGLVITLIGVINHDATAIAAGSALIGVKKVGDMLNPKVSE